MAQILVADTEKAVHGLLRQILRADGHEIKAVQSGRDMLDLLGQESFDLVILETSLPEVDGLTVCRRLRAEPAIAGMAVVFLTSRCSLRDKIDGFEAGCDQYIAKPFSVLELRWRIRALLRRGEICAGPQPLRFGPLALDSSRRRVGIGRRAAISGSAE